MGVPHTIDTKNPVQVARVVKAAFVGIDAGSSLPLIDRLFADVTSMFEGRYPGYQAIDMFYHDYEHTLQATVCLIQILQGHRNSGDLPKLDQRDWELALMAVLLHDSGYLKETNDRSGTGAKYTFVHERRSGAFARGYLPGLGVTLTEIEDISAAILCTGPQNKISQISFHREQARLFAFMLVTADYLGQMGAPDYVDELPILFREFQEAYDFEGTAPELRVHSSLEVMIARTPEFWQNYVRPLLDFEAGGVHRYLSTAGQPNPYLQAVEANLSEVRRRLQAGGGS